MTTPAPIGGHRHPGYAPVDAALADVEAAVREAVAHGSGWWLVLERVANGLTGRPFGYVARAAATAMHDAMEAVERTPVEELREAEKRDVACRCVLVGWASDPDLPHIPARAVREQVVDCPTHPLSDTIHPTARQGSEIEERHV